MFSPSDHFECHWHTSRGLLVAYGIAQFLALIALYMLAVPGWAFLLGLALCTAHCLWVVPGSILLSSPTALTGLRRNAEGWQLWSQRDGWQPAQLCRDSMALPLFVVLRFRLVGKGAGGRWHGVRGICIPCDAMAQDTHRRLRLRLKFSRRRWAAPE
ncbi:protein YgfX [Pseudomonas viridiflava]|uniref:protein YgfX n=1 Tax=Pseudomonas viridiflava TaxID=33069 RepID=UPI000F06D71D|nr:protein YgfX [Pseudomonas viridiflava]